MTWLIAILQSILPSLADRLIERVLRKRPIYIDRVFVSQSGNSLSFDITSSNTLDLDISLTQFYARFFLDTKGLVAISGVQEISSKYKVSHHDGKNIVEVNEHEYPLKSYTWITGNKFCMKCDLLEKQNAKSTNRFTIEWNVDIDLSTQNKINIVLSYSAFGKIIDTKNFDIDNPLYKDDGPLHDGTHISFIH